MNDELQEKMYQAFKEVMAHPDPNLSGKDLVKNGIKAAVAVMNQPDLEVLGFYPDGKPIRECEPGRIYTAAVVICKGCRKVIRGMGGPISGALCFDCNEAKSV